jgi:hypothetical protein
MIVQAHCWFISLTSFQQKECPRACSLIPTHCLPRRCGLRYKRAPADGGAALQALQQAQQAQQQLQQQQQQRHGCLHTAPPEPSNRPQQLLGPWDGQPMLISSDLAAPPQLLPPASSSPAPLNLRQLLMKVRWMPYHSPNV